MDELISKLKSGQSSESIEESIVAISAQDADSLQQHKQQIATALNTLIADNAQLPFDMNAKLRRRIKRLLSSMTGSAEPSSDQSEKSSRNNGYSDDYDKKIDAVLDTYAKSLLGSSNCEDIEKILTSIPMNDIQHNSPGLNALHNQLNTIANNESIEMNAKLRRRLKRSIESIAKFTVTEESIKNTQNSYHPAYTPPPMPDPVSMDETIRLLSSAQNLADVEYAMNSYVSILPPLGDEKEDPEVVKKKKALRQVMVNVLLSPQREFITNKRLRHRMERAAYQLDPTAPVVKKPIKPATKADKKATAAAAATTASSHSKTTTSSVPVSTATPSASSTTSTTSVFTLQENPINLATVTIDSILTTLAAATTANELLLAVESIPARKEDLLFCFRKVSSKNSLVTEAKKEDGDDKEDDTGAKEFDYDGAVKLLEIFTNILEEDGYVNADVSSSNTGSTDNDKGEGPMKIKLIAKTKRKIKRITVALADALVEAAPSPPVATSAARIATATVVKENTHTESTVNTEDSTLKDKETSLLLPPLEPIIESIRKCTNPAEIEALLNDVKPGAGSCKSRRTLKRTLDRLLRSEEEVDAKEDKDKIMKLTSNSRRKIKRVLKIIEPNAIDNAPSETPPAVSAALETASKKRKAVGEAGETDENGVIKKPKFRLFIGQMDFDTTPEDLEGYLRDQGLDCPINLRFLTNKETGKSRGAAFLDICGGKRSLKRCLSLHHTLLKGRRINVEKTSKGLKDEMAVKQRRIDLKIQESEKVDQMLQAFEDNTEKNKNGVFKVKNISDSMMNRLYALNTSEVQEILTQYSAASHGSDSDSADVFQRLVTAKDGGGSAVDQSRNKGYGGFNKGGSKFSASGPRGETSRGRSHGQGTGSASSGSSEDHSSGNNGNGGDVPWGYSGVPAASSGATKGNNSGLSGVFQSLRGRGGKRVGTYA